LTRLVRPSLGLLGRVVAILLLTVLIEFGASTLLYERASEFAVRDDEARRLAEHLVITQRLIAERPPEQRPAMAAELTTDRYAIRWDRVPPPLPRLAPPLDRMRSQMLDWEPSLRKTAFRVALADPGRKSAVLGGLRLDDGSWIQFRTLEPVAAVNLARERILLALIPAVALMIMAGLLVRRTLRPLRQLAVAADRVGDGETAPVPESGPGEVLSVVRAFNRMQERIQRLIDDRTRALAAVGHDLRTPLARLRLRSETIADPGSRREMESELEEMEAMIASMLAYLGGDEEPEAPARSDVAVLCATLVDNACDHGGHATYRGPDHHEALVRVNGLKRALDNLLSNSLHYAGRAELSLAPEADRLIIRVEDRGPGIPGEDLERVMEPFVRLDEARARDTVGFGLGLAIARRMVAVDGGTLTLRNRAGGGLTAEVVLPHSNISLQTRCVAAKSGH